jgi:hypothetical protein
MYVPEHVVHPLLDGGLDEKLVHHRRLHLTDTVHPPDSLGPMLKSF